MKNIALILASGTGSRCGLEYPKQFALIKGKTVLQHTVEKFQSNALVDEIILVTNAEYVEKVKGLTDAYSKVSCVLAGGVTRKDSSYNGISAIADSEANVLIHDGVRPLVTDEIINHCVEELKSNDAVCTTIDSTDTVYIVDENEYIKEIPVRRAVKRAQTPQCFKLSLIKKAHDLANCDPNCVVTDDCGLVNYYKLSDIKTINGDKNNIKITYREDLEFSEKFL